MLDEEKRSKIVKIIALAKESDLYEAVLNKMELGLETREQAYQVYLFLSSLDYFSRETNNEFLVSLL